MSKSNRFDPEAGKDYGNCEDCGIVLATEADAQKHRTETAGSIQSSIRGHGTRSHRTIAHNPPRHVRVRSAVESIVCDALDDAVRELWDLLEDASEDEILDALQFSTSFRDAWEEFCDE